MESTPIETKNLRLVPQTREEARAYVAQMQPQDKAAVSAAWLSLLEGSSPVDPWIHGFMVVHRDTSSAVGRCGFKGPPDGDGMVEIAYGVATHACRVECFDASSDQMRFSASGRDC
jgi:hypothetical protein